MDDWSVPGLAIAVVTDSSGVWSRGYGERNVEAGVPAIDPIVFTRTASKALTSTDYLRQFTGEYAFREQTLTVRLRGDDTLTLTVPGQPTYTLEPTAENTFTLKDQTGFSVEFKMTDGTPTQMVLHQPNGTFTAERKQSQ